MALECAMAKTTILEFRGKRTDPTPQIAMAICAKHGDRPEMLIEILHDLQEEVGHVPEASLPVIAKALNLSRAEVYGVLSFYHDFHTSPRKKHVIRICAAESCQSMGARALIALAEKLAKGKKIEIDKAYCLGLCATSPALMVNGEPKARVDAKALKQIVAGLT
jgi:formate dehydrogenase subunit gamma